VSYARTHRTPESYVVQAGYGLSLAEQRQHELLAEVDRLRAEISAAHAELDVYLSNHDTSLVDKIRQIFQGYLSFRDADKTRLGALREARKVACRTLPYTQLLEGYVAQLDAMIAAAEREATK